MGMMILDLSNANRTQIVYDALRWLHGYKAPDEEYDDRLPELERMIDEVRETAKRFGVELAEE